MISAYIEANQNWYKSQKIHHCLISFIIRYSSIDLKKDTA